MASQGAAALMGAISGYLLSTRLPTEELDSWGWRLPFLAGLLIVPIGLNLCHLIPETMRPGAGGRAALAEMLSAHWGKLLLGVMMIMGGTASTYINIFYMPTYLIKVVGLPPHTAFLTGCTAGQPCWWWRRLPGFCRTVWADAVPSSSGPRWRARF